VNGKKFEKKFQKKFQKFRVVVGGRPVGVIRAFGGHDR
jgi:hypothetical protein